MLFFDCNYFISIHKIDVTGCEFDTIEINNVNIIRNSINNLYFYLKNDVLPLKTNEQLLIDLKETFDNEYITNQFELY